MAFGREFLVCFYDLAGRDNFDIIDNINNIDINNIIDKASLEILFVVSSSIDCSMDIT